MPARAWRQQARIEYDRGIVSENAMFRHMRFTLALQTTVTFALGSIAVAWVVELAADRAAFAAACADWHDATEAFAREVTAGVHGSELARAEEARAALRHRALTEQQRAMERRCDAQARANSERTAALDGQRHLVEHAESVVESDVQERDAAAARCADAAGRRDRAAFRLAETEDDVANGDRRLAELRGSLASIALEIQDYEARIGQARSRLSPYFLPRGHVHPPRVGGSVVTVDAEGLVHLDVGTDDGVWRGQVFVVSRGERYVCMILVATVVQDRATAWILFSTKVPWQMPRTGDSVLSQMTISGR